MAAHDPGLDVTVVIPSLPSRSRLLQRAIGSTSRQTRPPAAVIVSNDTAGLGAWENRNRGILHVRTPWCAFLDDDDELLPHHLEHLVDLAIAEDAGLAWGWFDVVGGTDPFPQHRGRRFDPADPHIVPITYVVRTEVLFEAMVAVGGFLPDPDGTGAWEVQDAPLFAALVELGGQAVTDRITWLWHHHARNTSGVPSRVVPQTGDDERPARMKLRTPDEWRDHLLDKLAAQTRYHKVGDDYYTGDHPLPDAPNGARGEFLRLMRLARSNWCELIVDAVAERLIVDGVRFGNGADADLDVWQTIWQPNGLDAEHGQVHTEALIGGTAAVLVWPGETTDDAPIVSVEHPTEVYVAGGASIRQRRRAAVKRYIEDGYELVTVQLDARETEDGVAMVYKWARPMTSTKWEPYADIGDPGPAFPNPLGVVSFIPFHNKRRMIGAGVSELDGGITDIQDRINETLFNRITAARYSAFRQRWATGLDVPVDPETGKPIEPFRAAIDRLWLAEDDTVKFGEFSATDLRPFIDSVEADIQHLAAISRTPPHYLLGQSGAFPSGESLKATETGLVAKVEARALAFGESWVQVIRLALGAMQDARAADDSLEVVWRDPESKNVGELVDALVKLGSLGVPNEALWSQYGASPQEVARWRAMAARSQLAAAASSPPSTPPPAPRPPAADSTPPPAAEELVGAE